MISRCGQLFCHRVHHASRSDSCGYSTNRPQLVSLDVYFNPPLSLEHDSLLHVSLLVCVSTSSSLLTAAESYRGLNSQRGEASSPSGQLQRCQQENQEAPASLIHPFLPHAGQRPVGGGEQEGGGAGEEGVQGGFPREGVVFQRSSRVRHCRLLPGQRGGQLCLRKRS